MNMETIYLTKSKYDAISKFESYPDAFRQRKHNMDHIYTCSTGQEILVRDGIETLVEVKVPTRAKQRQKRRATHGDASLEARHNIDFPAGISRVGKRQYVAGLKKAIKKKVKPDSPKYWAIMKNYGFVPSEKKVDNGKL